MTICIGAICEKKYLVMATDRMITIRQPNIEYEQKGITKALEISPSCLAATAGSALAFSPILRDAVIEINKKSIKDISQIAEVVKKCYSGYRNQKLEENVLSPVGLSLQGFYQTNKALQPQLAATLFQAMQRFCQAVVEFLRRPLSCEFRCS